MLQIEGAELQIAEETEIPNAETQKHLRSLESLNCDPPPLFLPNPKNIWGCGYNSDVNITKNLLKHPVSFESTCFTPNAQ